MRIGPPESRRERSRNVLVLSGTGSIGKAVVSHLDNLGFTVAETYHQQSAPSDRFSVYCDLSDEASIESAFAYAEDELGAVERLVITAGTALFKPIWAHTTDDIARLTSVNLVGVTHALKRASRSMIRRRWGRIVVISSVAAVVGASWGSVYAAMKAAQLGLVRSLAIELGPWGITVNAILPGVIDSEITSGCEQMEFSQFQSPVGRRGSPREVAALVAYLLSEDAAFVNGAAVPIDGGLSLGGGK